MRFTLYYSTNLAIDRINKGKNMRNKMQEYSLVLMALMLLISAGVAISSGIQNKKLKKSISDLKSEITEKSQVVPATSTQTVKTEQPTQPNEKNLSELKALKKKLSDKNTDLENLKKENAALQEKLKQEPRGRWNADNRGGPGGGADFFERLRKEDPERYKQMRQHVNEMTQRVETAAVEQQTFLGALDTAKMNEEQLQNHNKILDMVKKNAEIAAKINQDPESKDADALRQEMFGNFREMRGLLDSERAYALQDLGRSMGYGEQDTATFTEYVNQVYNMTSMRALFGGGGGHGDGGQNPGGGNHQNR